jgi:hypothetical protein
VKPNRKHFSPIKLSNIDAGPIRHATLPEWFLERVTAYKAKLGNVEPSTIEKTLQDFQRDVNPERELEVWERITDAYVMYVGKNNVRDHRTNRHVFAELLGESMG